MNLQIYDPANARRLTKQEIDDLQNLTVEDIKELAAMFPNNARGNAYLVLKDTTAKTQIYPLSTWGNLYSLISKQGKKQYIPFNFRILFNQTINPTRQPEIPLGKVQDLTDDEKKNAEGLRYVVDLMPDEPPQIIEREEMVIPEYDNIKTAKRSTKKVK